MDGYEGALTVRYEGGYLKEFATPSFFADKAARSCEELITLEKYLADKYFGPAEG